MADEKQRQKEQKDQEQKSGKMVEGEFQPGQDAPPGTSEHLGSDRPYEGAPTEEVEDRRG